GIGLAVVTVRRSCGTRPPDRTLTEPFGNAPDDHQQLARSARPGTDGRSWDAAAGHFGVRLGRSGERGRLATHPQRPASLQMAHRHDNARRDDRRGRRHAVPQTPVLRPGEDLDRRRGPTRSRARSHADSLRAAAPCGVVEFTLTTLRDAATSLGEGLDARMDQEGSFLRLELRGANPVDITAIVNAVAQRYVTVYADLKRQKLIELTKILGEQLQHAQENLHGAEASLQRFREETITLPGDRPSVGGASVAGAAVGGPGATGAVAARDPVFGSFFDMQISREQARRDRDALDRLLAQAGDSGLSAEALSVVGLVQANPELTQALTELMTKQAELRA